MLLRMTLYKRCNLDSLRISGNFLGNPKNSMDFQAVFDPERNRDYKVDLLEG